MFEARKTQRQLQRTVIVHYHIFKNAGSSVDNILKENFRDHWTSFEGETPTSVLPPSTLQDFLRERPGISAVSSHLLRPPPVPDPNIIPIIFLRDPLDRAYSVYSHERRSETTVTSGEIAKRHDFAGYVDWCLNNLREGGLVIANYQVIHLSPASLRCSHIYDAQPTEQDFNAILKLFSAIPFVGIVEEFEKSIACFGEICAGRDIPMQTFPSKINVSPERTGSLSQRRCHLRAVLPVSLMDAFTQANILDEKLYRWACQKFQVKFAQR